MDSLLPVQVWGMDANALPFSSIASVKNFSGAGAVLRGLARQMKPGLVLELLHAGRRAPCRVVWVGSRASRREGEVGVEFLPEQGAPWEMTTAACVQGAANS